MTTTGHLVAAFFCFITLVGCNGSPEKTTPDIPDLSLQSLMINGNSVALEKGKTATYEVNLAADTQTIDIQVGVTSEVESAFYTFSNGDRAISSTEFIPGDAITLTVGDGTNRLAMTLVDATGENSLTYAVHLYRLSRDASLTGYVFYDNDDNSIALSPTFSSTHYDYTANVDYDTCFYYGQFYTGYADNTVTLNGDDIDNAEIFARYLEPGENIFDTHVKAAVGEREVIYSVGITREQPTETQLQANARLAQLTIDDTDMDFLCAQNVYSIAVNSDQPSLEITAKPEVDGIDMVIGDQDLTANEPITIPLADGDTLVQLVSTALNGSQTQTYSMYVYRRTTNMVSVSTAAELQQALQNAQPNDQIVVAPGTYAGEIATSGNSEAHFYSGRSGTPLNPIYLIAEDSDEDTVLRGNVTGAGTVFKLSGDNWRVSGLEISQGATGVHLASASNNRLSDLDIHDVAQAVRVDQGSDKNEISRCEFSAINGSNPPLVQVADAETSIAGSTRLKRNEFYTQGEQPALYLAAGADSTLIEANRLQDLSTATSDDPVPLLLVHGNNTQLRFNSFYPVDTADARAPLRVENPGNGWGNNTWVYGNWLVATQTDLLLEAETATHLYATENLARAPIALEEDYRAATYSGGSVEVDTFTPPQFQIVLADETGSCLDLEEVNEVNIVIINPCSDAQTQRWTWEMAADTFMYLRNLSEDDYAYMMPTTSFTASCTSIASATSVAYLSTKRYGYAQQWAPIQGANDEEYYLANRQNLNYGLTVAGGTYTPGTAAVVCPLSDSKRQTFLLREIE